MGPADACTSQTYRWIEHVLQHKKKKKIQNNQHSLFPRNRSVPKKIKGFKRTRPTLHSQQEMRTQQQKKTNFNAVFGNHGNMASNF